MVGVKTGNAEWGELMPYPQIYVKLTEEQRQAIEQSLDDPWLKGEMPVIEKIFDGKASPLEVVNLIKLAWRVGHLKGMVAITDLHNRIARIGEE